MEQSKIIDTLEPYHPNTPNTSANCIGALVRRGAGDKSVIWMVEIYFYNLKNLNSKVASDKSANKRYCNA